MSDQPTEYAESAPSLLEGGQNRGSSGDRKSTKEVAARPMTAKEQEDHNDLRDTLQEYKEMSAQRAELVEILGSLEATINSQAPKSKEVREKERTQRTQEQAIEKMIEAQAASE